VPMDPQAIDDFDPFSVPTIRFCSKSLKRNLFKPFDLFCILTSVKFISFVFKFSCIFFCVPTLIFFVDY